MEGSKSKVEILERAIRSFWSRYNFLTHVYCKTKLLW